MGKVLEWTPAMKEFCRDNTHLTRKELHWAFNDKFATDRAQKTIESFCKRHRFLTNRSGQFKKGQKPHNTGKKGWSPPGSEATRFKKGDLPPCTLPTGAKTKTTPKPHRGEPGYWKIKTAQPRGWVFLHRKIWEEVNGPVPSGHVLIFKDMDTDNVVLENIACITRGELVILNKRLNWKEAKPEQRESILLMAKIMYVSGRLMRGESLNDTKNTLRAICEEKGLVYQTVYVRLQRNGGNLEQALRTK